MRHGWVYIYESPPASHRFEELVDQLALDGISLSEPGTGRVIRLSPTGEQIPSSKQDILKECENSTEVRFNLYFARSDHLFCLIQKLNAKVLREAYSLDGKTEQESQSLIGAVLRLFAKAAEKGKASALVVDRNAGLHREFHWDDFVVGDVEVPPEWPMVLAFSRNFKKTGAVPRQTYNIEEYPEYIILRKK